MFQRLHFVKMLKIEKVIEILKCDPCRATPIIDIYSITEEPRLEIYFLQHFFFINITKNSHPFLIFQHLHFVQMLKIENVTEN